MNTNVFVCLFFEGGGWSVLFKTFQTAF